MAAGNQSGRTPAACGRGSSVTQLVGGEFCFHAVELDASYGRRLLPKLAERTGIDKRVHAHRLRHSHAAELVTAGVPLHVIADQLGHASAATTDAYLSKLVRSDRIPPMRAAGGALEAE